jgi:hypothetical protein
MSKQVKMKPNFDPKKNYKWEPSDTFKLTGQQFASLYHLLSQEMNVPGGAPLSLKVEAHGVIMALFQEGVVEGVISEANQEDITAVEEGNIRQLFKQ